MFTEAISRYLERHSFERFQPKAVLFDMDGVLYNSMYNHARAWHTAMERHSIDMPETEAFRLEGMRGVEIIQMKMREQLGKSVSDEDAQRIYEEKSAVFSSLPPVSKMEGVEELMRQIKADGLKICVVTGSGQHALLNKLERDFEGLVKRNMVITSFDVKQGKPAPEPYLKGLQKADVQPWEAIVIENAPLGIRAATAAHIFTIAVNTGPLPENILAEEGANLIFKKMTDLRDFWHNFSEKM